MSTPCPESVARMLLYELWYGYAERLLERVIAVTELDATQAAALRQIALRPNDFAVVVEGDATEEEEEEERED